MLATTAFVKLVAYSQGLNLELLCGGCEEKDVGWCRIKVTVVQLVGRVIVSGAAALIPTLPCPALSVFKSSVVYTHVSYVTTRCLL